MRFSPYSDSFDIVENGFLSSVLDAYTPSEPYKSSLGKKGLFIDIDDTIVKGNTAFGFADFLAEKGAFKLETYRKMKEVKERYKKKEISQNEAVRMYTDLYREGTKDLTVEKESELASEFVRDRVTFFEDVADTITEFKKELYCPILVSATPCTVAREIAKVVGAEDSIGTGREDEYITSEEKYRAITKKIDELKLDMKESVGIDDSLGGIGIFQHVMIPIVWNPRNGIRIVAIKNCLLDPGPTFKAVLAGLYRERFFMNYDVRYTLNIDENRSEPIKIVEMWTKRDKPLQSRRELIEFKKEKPRRFAALAFKMIDDVEKSGSRYLVDYLKNYEFYIPRHPYNFPVNIDEMKEWSSNPNFAPHVMPFEWKKRSTKLKNLNELKTKFTRESQISILSKKHGIDPLTLLYKFPDDKVPSEKEVEALFKEMYGPDVEHELSYLPEIL